jgi:outer membrane protein TolC
VLYDALPGASPRIAAAGAQARAAEARVAPARRLPDPQLQFGWMDRMLPGLDRDPVLGMDQIQLMQMVPVAGQLGLAGRAAQERADAAAARATEVSWEVRGQVAMAFYELYRIDRSIVLERETLRLLGDLHKQAETMYAVGEGRQADVLRAQVEIARMAEEITRMEAERLAMVARLEALFARASIPARGRPVLPVFPHSLPLLDSLQAEAATHRPMVRAMAAEVSAAGRDAARARREIWPDLQFGVQYSQRPMAGGGTGRMLSLMVGASVPLWAGSRQFAMRREAEAMQTMLGAEFDALQADTRGQVAGALAMFDRDRRLAELYRTTILPQAEATLRSARASYRTGTVDFMTVLDDQMTLNKYGLDLVTLEATQGTTLAELEMLLGRALFDPSVPAGEGAAR